jgi:nucleoside-diphosphate-sugar epimerase
MIHVYVFGANGFIGSSVSKELADLNIKHFRVFRSVKHVTFDEMLCVTNLLFDQAIDKLLETKEPTLINNCVGLTKLDSDNSYHDMLEANYFIPLRISASIVNMPNVKIVHLSSNLIRIQQSLNRTDYSMTKRLGDAAVLLLDPDRYQIIHSPLILARGNKSSELVSILEKMCDKNILPVVKNPNKIVNFCTLQGIVNHIISAVDSLSFQGQLVMSLLKTYNMPIKEIVGLRKIMLENKVLDYKKIFEEIRSNPSQEFPVFLELDSDAMKEVLSALKNL